MNDANRRKYDKAEASGQLARLRRAVQSFCAPVWWESGGNTILGNGSMCVISTPDSLFAVTANHVLTAYEACKKSSRDVFCQLGAAPFDLSANVLDRSAYWDLATFRVPEFTLEHWGRQVYRAPRWPPPPIKNNDPIILGGYPENRRTQDAGAAPAAMRNDFVSFIAYAENWSDSHMAFCLDSNSWYWPQGESLPPNPELSGASGGPCFLMLPREDRVDLAGFIYEAHTEYEIVRVRHASLIGCDGALVAPPPGARPSRR